MHFLSFHNSYTSIYINNITYLSFPKHMWAENTEIKIKDKHRYILSVQQEGTDYGGPWHSTGALHSENCARLANTHHWKLYEENSWELDHK